MSSYKERHELIVQSIGIVVIGRNEGQRLQRALGSVPRGAAAALYVDSGSSDGSVGLAHSMDISVHELDPAEPFSAGRARREGAEILTKRHPALEWIQFLDGDSVLDAGWIEKAAAYLAAHSGAGIVCGLLTEEAPERSVYNRIIAVRWNAVTGDIDACGGIFMIRRSVYEEVGGFNRALLTGEESELCSRVRMTGCRIVRLDEKMARHDAALVKFSQWWQRAVWGGYGDAMEYDVLRGTVTVSRRRETRSISIWVVGAPVIGLIGLLGGIWSAWFMILPAMCVMAYLTLISRIMRDRLQRGDAVSDAALYAVFCVLRKLPYSIGFFRYRIFPGSCGTRPDPHAPNGARGKPAEKQPQFGDFGHSDR